MKISEIKEVILKIENGETLFKIPIIDHQRTDFEYNKDGWPVKEIEHDNNTTALRMGGERERTGSRTDNDPLV